MAVKTVSIHEAKAELSRLLDLVAGGASFVIADDGKPIAKVIPFDAPAVPPARRLDFMKGQLKGPANFDRLGDVEIETMFLGDDNGADGARAERVTAFAVEVLGSMERAVRFLDTPHMIISGSTPIQLAREGDAGADRVINILGRSACSGGV